jgi:hypothetical protein
MKKNFKNSSTTHASTIYLFLLSSIAKSFLDLGTDYRNTILRPRTSSLMVLTTILWKITNSTMDCAHAFHKFQHPYLLTLLGNSHIVLLCFLNILICFWLKKNSFHQVLCACLTSFQFIFSNYSCDCCILFVPIYL